MRLLLVNALLFTLGVSACQPTSPPAAPPENLADQVAKWNTELGRRFEAGNADSLAALYAPDATLSPNGGPFVRGQAAIRAFWAQALASGRVTQMRTQTEEVHRAGDSLVYETGRSSSTFITASGHAYPDTVKYVNVWRRLPNGQWRLAVDFWNKPHE